MSSKEQPLEARVCAAVGQSSRQYEAALAVVADLESAPIEEPLRAAGTRYLLKRGYC